jgi:hypothetical protein
MTLHFLNFIGIPTNSKRWIWPFTWSCILHGWTYWRSGSEGRETCRIN